MQVGRASPMQRELTYLDWMPWNHTTGGNAATIRR